MPTSRRYAQPISACHKELYGKGKISKDNTHNDGKYFKLNTAERTHVDKMAKDTCLSTRFLFLSCDDIHSRSKQELKNDMVEGDNNYLRTMAATLYFLQYHDLHSSVPQQGRFEYTLAQKGEKGKSRCGGKGK